MDAQEEAKIAAVGKKPNVCFSMNEPETNQIQPILDELQKVLQTVLKNQNQKPEVRQTHPILVAPKRRIPNYLVLQLAIVRIRPKAQIDVRITTIEYVRTRRMIHPDRDEIATKILDRIETGDQIRQIASIGSRLGIKDSEPSHPIGIKISHEMADHLQEWLTLSSKAKRTVHPGVEVAVYVEREIVIQNCIVAVQALRDHLQNPVLPHQGTPW